MACSCSRWRSSDVRSSDDAVAFEGALFKKQIHRADLQPEKLLGAGQFGEVYFAFQSLKDKGTGTVVRNPRAVKMLKGEADKKAKEEFMRECNMMLDIGEHPNVVQMVGVAVQQVPWLCVLEFQPFGDLREVVMGAKAKGVQLTVKEQVGMMQQVRAGSGCPFWGDFYSFFLSIRFTTWVCSVQV